MMMIQAMACLIIIAILANFIYKRIHRRFYQLLEQFPSHPTYPLIGNMHVWIGSYEGMLERAEKILEPFDRQVFWLGPVAVLFLKKHDDIAIILNECLHRDSFGLVDEWLGVGMLSAKYKDWKISRKVLTPGFTSDKLAKYVDTFNENASNLVQRFKPVPEADNQIDVFHCLMMTNVDTFSKNLLGIDAGERLGEIFCNALIEGFEHGAKRIQWPLLLNRVVNKIYLKISGKFKIIDRIHHLPAQAVRMKLRNHADYEHRNNVIDTQNADSSEAMINLLIRNRLEKGLTETRITEELVQLLVPGLEGTAITMTWLLLMLAINQDAQQKLYEEITQLVTADERVSETHLINHLKYLEQCVKETLRRFAVVAVTGRRTHKEILLKDNAIVPKDTFILLGLHFANYDPDLYSNPEKWDPDHFSQQAVEQRPKTSRMGFGYGPRHCIGDRYAMMLMKTQIVYILRKYHLSTSIKKLTNRDLITDLGVRSKLGYPVTFRCRREE